MNSENAPGKRLERQLLEAAELVNAPDSAFAAHSINLLAVAERNIGDGLTTVTNRQMFGLLGSGLADVAVWITIMSRALSREDLSGEAHAEISALVNEAMSATAAAYGALYQAYRRYGTEGRLRK